MTVENKQKATIINLDTNETVTCQFNPGEYTFTKRNTWKQNAGKGQDVPVMEFSGGKPAQLKMELFFDTTAKGEDVREKYTDKLIKMTQIGSRDASTNVGEPPKCRFQWGSTWSFIAVLTNIQQKFIMFLGDGTPVRAKVNVTFQQVQEEGLYPPQNPTSLSQARRTRVIQPGDRLDLIAFQEYGDANRWYELAQANNLTDPMTLQPGQVLKIVSLT